MRRRKKKRCVTKQITLFKVFFFKLVKVHSYRKKMAEARQEMIDCGRGDEIIWSKKSKKKERTKYFENDDYSEANDVVSFLKKNTL